ncbi:Zn-dependent carboxypeptidase [Rubrobacter radiotolerans]|uniref:Metal-dependent carboxypeptidase n=2 Tax=Rubrobacter radiotolerans TaxID=42256 RepID=A0A023X1L3_RUBRA|nr:carboxypeptidase M32 [Rubrobacter radiotolerans]AHY46367.1 Zn-dependent carboxypeptidase [Rubrobacter radiotolerans]MDX5893774.1 carboxypeptidase M32 [Rubrobacter radiotolerans]SMC04473.1 carboxypeptidase Taq Metallo peptidase. MEROPS family M32 [Rubrobacter radiotolerans DSM 5868]
MQETPDTPATQEERLAALTDRLRTVYDLGAAQALMHWDQETYMPPQAVGLRSEQLATLSRLSHEHLVSPETEATISALEGKDAPDPKTEAGATVRLARRSFDRATKLPESLVAESARATSLAQPAWVEARQRADFALFAPHLEGIIDLQRRTAECLGYGDHPYDALLDLYEPGARKAALELVFEELKERIVPLLARVTEAASREATARDSVLLGEFDEAAQEAFVRSVLTDLGYRWDRGRQDRVVHAFCINIGGPEDVRLTTNFSPARIDKALFTSMHEAGHGMYEQGVDPAYSRTPLGGGVSMGVHESQSRLFENLVGRSRPFWSHYLPRLKEAFPEAFAGVGTEAFYRAVNEARPGFIRIDSDELTYNLHILLRFELEVALIEGTLSVSDLPDAWNERMERYLGLVPENDALGVLQDVHWSAGLFGYFPTYTLGNVLSVQLYQAALEDHPEIPTETATGRFETLRGWMEEHVYRHGSRYDPEDLIPRATGRPLTAAPYLEYLEEKFTDLYAL